MSGVLSVSSFAEHVHQLGSHNALQNDAYKNTFGNPGSNAQGGIVASMPAGSFAGALIVSWLADKIGRKRSSLAPVGFGLLVVFCNAPLS